MRYFVIFLGGMVKCTGCEVCVTGRVVETTSMKLALAQKDRLVSQYGVQADQVHIIFGRKVAMPAENAVQEAAERGFQS